MRDFKTMDQKPDNAYAKEYYDTQVEALAGSYTDARWHSSVVGEFDHRQTSRALDTALGTSTYATAVEIGPGDAVWTKKLRERVSGRIHLVEQSLEMLSKAQAHLSGVSDITFERADFIESNPPTGNDLVFAIRCLEYFADKPAALKKMHSLLRGGGRVIIVTKNAKFLTGENSQRKKIHAGQVTRGEMVRLLKDAGFAVEGVFPATLRWKAAFAPARVFFDFVHRVALFGLRIPFFDPYATESYAYIARRV